MSHSIRSLFKVFCMLIILCVVGVSAYAEIVQLDFPSAQSTFAYDINNNNVIVGSYSEDGPWGDKKVFTYSVETGYIAIDTHLEDMGIPVEAQAGIGINDNGIVVGHYRASAEVSHRFGGFVYRNGETFLLNLPAENPEFTIPAGINSNGKIVGAYEGQTEYGSGFLYDGGLPVDPTRFIDICYSAENLRGTFASGINDNDIVIGWVDEYTNETGHRYYSFIYDANTAVYSPLIRYAETARQTVFLDINNLGIVTGVAELDTGEIVAFLYDTATGEFSTGLGGYGINDAGHLVAGGALDGGTNSHGYWFIPAPASCEEDDTGAIDIVGVQAACGELTRVPIRIQNAYKPEPTPEDDNVVSAFGFDVTYDPAVLTFVDFERGELLAGFDDVTHVIDVDHNQVATGVVRVGGFTTVNPIGADQEGILGYLIFSPLQPVTATPVGFEYIVDHMRKWPASGACLTTTTGDINLDGEVTPEDALCAFEEAIDRCDTTCGSCDSVPCDVNQDCQCSATDALCIFNRYLGIPSCLDS